MLRGAAPLLLVVTGACAEVVEPRATPSPSPADAAPVRFRRLDATPDELLRDGAIWNVPPAPADRPPSERSTRASDGALVLHENAVFAAQWPARTSGRLVLSLRGRVDGGDATVRLASLYEAVPLLAQRDAVPEELFPRLHRTLLEAPWPGDATELELPAVDGDPGTTWLCVSVATGPRVEATLERVVVDELLEPVVARRAVATETRPALPIAAGRVRRLALGDVPAGALVEIGLAPPEDAALRAAPLTIRCRLDGSRERELAIAFASRPGAPPVHPWQDVLFHVERDRRAAVLELEVDGPLPSAVFVTPPSVLPRREPDSPPSILLFSVDTLRADHAGGRTDRDGAPATPHLDAFAGRSIRFTRAFTPANFTTPAHASMLTGLQPLVHGALRYGERRSIRRFASLAEQCARAGLATAAFTGGGLIDAAFGFDDGFERYTTLDPLMTSDNPRFARSPRREMPEWNVAARESASLERVTRWIEAHAQRRFFLFLHTYHAHDYSPREASARRFGVDPAARWQSPVDLPPEQFGAVGPGSPQLAHYRGLYDATVSEVDRAFGEVLAALERSGALDHTVVLLTADHGEAFQEHGTLFHSTGLFNEVLHVPLLVRAPGFAPAEVDEPVSLIDVAPTLLELAGVPSLPGANGRSLVPLLRGEEGFERMLLAQDAPPGELTHSALVSGRFKYLRLMKSEQETAREQLYDLVADPLESRDLAAEPAFAATLAKARAALDRTLAEMQAAAARAARGERDLELGADLDEELRLLGYVEE